MIMDIRLNILRADVLGKVHEMAGYTGAKMVQGDDGAYVRVATTEADERLLSEFVDRAKADVVMGLGRYGARVLENEDTGVMVLALDMPSNYDTRLNDAVCEELANCMLYTAVGYWFMLTNKQEAVAYVQMAQGSLAAARQMLSKRVAPVRVVPTVSDEGDGVSYE